MSMNQPATTTTNNFNLILSNKFQTRISPLGAVITRIFYIVYINNQLSASLNEMEPNSKMIQNSFFKSGSDLKIYLFNDTLCKYLLSNLYVKGYPLTPKARGILQGNLNTALQSYLYNPASQNAYVIILYYELYQSQTYGYNVSRVLTLKLDNLLLLLLLVA